MNTDLKKSKVRQAFLIYLNLNWARPTLKNTQKNRSNDLLLSWYLAQFCDALLIKSQTSDNIQGVIRTKYVKILYICLEWLVYFTSWLALKDVFFELFQITPIHIYQHRSFLQHRFKMRYEIRLNTFNVIIIHYLI